MRQAIGSLTMGWTTLGGALLGLAVLDRVRYAIGELLMVLVGTLGGGGVCATKLGCAVEGAVGRVW